MELAGPLDFDLVKTLECGQCFRWDADENGTYTGVAKNHAVRLRQNGDNICFSCSAEEFDAVWRDYFDLCRDYASIRLKLSIDGFMHEAAAFGAGMRILRQDSWEALCSFIISQCNNIPRIKKIISVLCREFGDEISFEGAVYHSFPSAQRLATLDISDLEPLRCGYRADYILCAARAVADGRLDLDALSSGSPENARKELKELRGVGDKVADCVMLYGLNMLDSFPMDVWIKRAIRQQYRKGFDPKVFSPYAGIAQQYIFHYIRHHQK